MKRDKQRKAFISGILALIIGFWMIFVAGDNWGILLGAIGTLLIMWRFNGR